MKTRVVPSITGAWYDIVSQDGRHIVYLKGFLMYEDMCYLGNFDSYQAALEFIRGHRDRNRPTEIDGEPVRKVWGKELGPVTFDESD